ncbi:MAG: rane protein involved in aromatic hydrocarbon degradation, partial [Verrucomicrobiaceae bacterium]|nr:rane protein involved in aromatic hydrocarbon degradation [Verrucomicrobiaceae bacterium]
MQACFLLRQSQVFAVFSVALCGCVFFTPLLKGNGLERNGVGARSLSMGGASVADTDDAFSSMTLNPSALGFLKAPDLFLSGTAVSASGNFRDQFGDTGRLSEQWLAIPDIVARTPLSEDLALGFSVVPDSSRQADWHFQDPPGGAGGHTSYGYQQYHSEILNVRAALGLGLRLSDSWSFGASVGGVYNRNELKVPYIFQSHPALAGMKTLLDMETDGYGINGDLGLTWKASKDLTFGLS